VGLLNDFCGAVQGRMRKFGFDWSQLIVVLLPVVVEMISTCFNKASDLEAFATGKRGPLQMAGLRIKCRRVVQEQGVRGIFRVSAAASDLQRAILDELEDRAGKASGPDLWQAAIDEAASV
jgi:hypothetical protein